MLKCETPYYIKINIHIIELLNNQLNQPMELIDEYYNNMDSRIKTIPGIGSLIGSIILSYIGDVKSFDAVVKLRAYTGMDPVTRQSGNYNISFTHI